MVENPSSHSLFDQNSSGAILGFIDEGFAFSLNPEECPSNWRPAQNRRIAEMEYIMEAIVILLDLVVGQAVADIYSAALQPHICLPSTRSLGNVNFETPRKLFFPVFIFIEWRAVFTNSRPSCRCLGEVESCAFSKANTSIIRGPH